MKIGIIGYGNMAKALCKGLLLHANHSLMVSSPSLSTAHPHPQLRTHPSNLEVVGYAQILILAVKPNHMADVLKEISTHLQPQVVVISIASGLGFEWFRDYLPEQLALVRAMPNLAAEYGQSATPLMANPHVSLEQKNKVTSLFQACGAITWLTKESDLDIFTALSGSGLAYFFRFTEAMRKSAMTLGLEESIATQFALQTLKGAASLAALSPQSLQELQNQVTSKGGTTAAALAIFDQYDLSSMVSKAMTAAVTRSQTLRKKE